ncbi:palmitoyltransferase swf1 [Coemansia sp. Benny D115]|nr:palmitoyltransferase swf1 [Coemansia sp. Benny D115]
MGLFTAAWVSALLAFSAWLFVLLLGRNRMFRGTVVERANIYCMETLPGNIDRWMRRGVSDSMVDKLEGLWMMFFGQRNPLFQIFAITLYLLGLAVFMTQAAPMVPNRYLGAWHWAPIVMTLAVNMGSYAKACVADPGVVNMGNVAQAQRVFRPDGLLYQANNLCRTCKVVKPARSKHCSVCGCCVQMMDHHCMWLNNCIGLNNARWFLVFLGSFTLVCLYGSYIFGTVLLELRQQNGLELAMVRDPDTGQLVPLSFRTSILYLLDENVLLAVLLVMLVILTPAIAIFTLYQLRIVSLGYTSNEETKWLTVADAIQDEVVFFVTQDGGSEAVEIIEREDQSADKRPRRLVRSLAELKNPYHRSVWANLAFILFPPRASLASSASTAQTAKAHAA